MKEIIISTDDILDMNIRLARDLVVQANTTPYKAEKIKALFMANQIIERSLIKEGIDLKKTKIKKET